MDEEMEEVEIVFAQRLASGEPNIRKRALKLLREHIKETSEKEAFTSDSLARLCKGLHYALWMQDKMLLQEELADAICDLTQLFEREENVLEFARALIFTLSKEWPLIDRWRMDKFLMLIRRLIRTLFRRLSAQKWDADMSRMYIEFFTGTTISANSRISESLKYHCASVWLDELDTVGEGMTKERCLDFLNPYIQLLKEKISDTFFRSICTDIFDTILIDCSQQIAEKELKLLEGDEAVHEDDPTNNSDVEEQEQQETHLEFDYGKIAELLFEAGKQPSVTSTRRKRLYGLCKKFENASSGVDPSSDLNETTKPLKAGWKKKKGKKCSK